MNINQIIEEFKSLYLLQHIEHSIEIIQLVKVSSESWVIFLEDLAHGEYTVGWLSVYDGEVDPSDLKYYSKRNTSFEHVHNEFLKCFSELS